MQTEVNAECEGTKEVCTQFDQVHDRDSKHFLKGVPQSQIKHDKALAVNRDRGAVGSLKKEECHSMVMVSMVMVSINTCVNQKITGELVSGVK